MVQAAMSVKTTPLRILTARFLTAAQFRRTSGLRPNAQTARTAQQPDSSGLYSAMASMGNWKTTHTIP